MEAVIDIPVLSGGYHINSDYLLFSLLGYTSRPEKLLVFINPVGGRKEAEKIFQSKVEPLFYLAKLKYDIVGKLTKSFLLEIHFF